MIEEVNAQHNKYQSQTANLSSAKIHYLKAGIGEGRLC